MMQSDRSGSFWGSGKKHILGCPGPTNVSQEVKLAQLGRDICHKEPKFCDLVKRVNQTALALLDGGTGYTSVTLTCSGTGANEAMLSQVRGRMLVLNNGRYAQRLYDMAITMGIDVEVFVADEKKPIDYNAVEAFLRTRRDNNGPAFSEIACVHHETERGILNPVKEIGELCAEFNLELLIDGISGIGGHPFSLRDVQPAFCTVSSNKCLESVPGVSFVFCRKSSLNKRIGVSRSPYFDLARHNEKQQMGEMLFTPATHVLLALDKALVNFAQETYQGRVDRYQRLNERFHKKLQNIGLIVVNSGGGSNIVTLIQLPRHVNYGKLCETAKSQGVVLFTAPDLVKEGILSIATMGCITEQDTDHILEILESSLVQQACGSAGRPGYVIPIAKAARSNAITPYQIYGRIELLQVGIIGAGPRAAKLMSGFQSKGVGVSAICDVVGSRAQDLANQSSKAIPFDRIDEFLAAGTFDAVVVCTNAENHALPVILSAEAGMPVLCEKPLGQSLAECDAMIEAGRKNNVVISCHLQSHYFPRTKWLKEHIAKGSFGKTVTVRASGATIHIWDSLLSLLGPVEQVYACWPKGKEIKPDIRRRPLLATLMFEAGHTAVVEAFPVYLEKRPRWTNSLSIHGDDIQIGYDLWTDGMTIDGCSRERIAFLQQDFRLKYPSPDPLGGFVDNNHPVISDFISALAEGREPLVGATDARASIELVTAAYKSAALMNLVSLPLSENDPFCHAPGCLIPD